VLLASGLIPLKLRYALFLQFLMGCAASTFNMANVRLAMVISPEMGRTHFFALFSVVANSTLGLAPVLWGLLIDLLGRLDASYQGFNLNRYSVFYLATGLLFAMTLILIRRLEEPAAARVGGIDSRNSSDLTSTVLGAASHSPLNRFSISVSEIPSRRS